MRHQQALQIKAANSEEEAEGPAEIEALTPHCADYEIVLF